MSDTKNHKLAIKAIIEAHRTSGKMREIMLTILADKPSAIVNAWEEINKQDENTFHCSVCSKENLFPEGGKDIRCFGCGTLHIRITPKQSESP